MAILRTELSDLKEALARLYLRSQSFRQDNDEVPSLFFHPRRLLANLHQAPNFMVLLAAVHSIEDKIYSHINNELSRLDPDLPLNSQESILAKVRDEVLLLGEVNKLLIANVSDYLNEAPPNVISIVQRIITQSIDAMPLDAIHDYNPRATPEAVAISNQNARFFLADMKKAITLALMKTALIPAGAHFISKFEQTLRERNHHIEMMINYVSSPQSFTIDSKGSKSTATSSPNIPKSGTLAEKLKPIVKNSHGESSWFLVPVWPETGKTIDDIFFTYFSDETQVAKAVDNLIMGSFGFKENGQLFYSPMTQDIDHELIHAVHNSRGTNRANINRSDELLATWDDSEEFWAITGGKISENSLRELSNNQLRFGHRGISAFAILNPQATPEATATLNALSGGPAPR